jgi:hypothetical protein
LVFRREIDGFKSLPASEGPMFGHILEKFLEEGTNIKNYQIPQKLQHKKDLVGITKGDD